jgi:hypothetical protein
LNECPAPLPAKKHQNCAAAPLLQGILFFLITGYYWIIKCEEMLYFFILKRWALKLIVTLLLISFEFILDLCGKEKKYKGIIL